MSRALCVHLERALANLGPKKRAEQVQLANEIINLLGEQEKSIAIPEHDALPEECEILEAVSRPCNGLVITGANFPPPPGIPLDLSELLVNARGEQQVGNVLKKELLSADRVDLICSFLKWSGFRLIRESLADVIQRNGQIRVLTTAYCGATDERVIEALQEMGAEVRVSLDTRRTRMHAKSWLLHRNSGFSTAFIGSSNMSAAALQEGLEWNVRISAVENKSILESFQATFDGYWEDSEFQAWSEKIREQFRAVINEEKYGGQSGDAPLLGLDLRPYPCQEEILEKLQSARLLHGRHKNLVVAATGTGKTMVAAFDYLRLCEEQQKVKPGSPRPSTIY